MTQLNWTFNDCQILPKRMKNDPLLLFDQKVDGERFRPTLERIWCKERSHHPAGRPPYDVVLMFKIIILGVRNSCSDAALEEYRRNRISWRRFLHWDGPELTPDEKTIWKYRMVLAESGEVAALFDGYTTQMEAAGYHPQDGLLIDSSWGSAPKQRNTRAENEALKEGQVPPAWELQPHQLRQKDRDATWSCQHQKWQYGYKNHINVDRKYKIIMRFAVTTASPHDRTPFESLLMPTRTSRGVWADRAHASAAVMARREDRRYDNPIRRRESRQRPWAECERQAHPCRVRVRSRVEHGFGVVRGQLGGPEVRAIGLTRVRCWVGLKNLLDNMHRFIPRNAGLRRCRRPGWCRPRNGGASGLAAGGRRFFAHFSGSMRKLPWCVGFTGKKRINRGALYNPIQPVNRFSLVSLALVTLPSPSRLSPSSN